MRIRSHPNPHEELLQRLRDIIEVATGGTISPGGDLEPAEELPELVDQVDITCASLLETLDSLEDKYDLLSEENLNLALRVDKQEEVLKHVLETLEGGVKFDEELDHATIDFMEAIMATGAAESTFDGELSFAEHVVFSKEDLKPIVRGTIDSWLRLKLS